MLKYRNALLWVLFSMGFVRALYLPVSFVDASILLIVGVVLSYMEYKNQDAKVSQIEKELAYQKEQLKELQDKISSIKVIQQAKPGSLAFRQ